MTNKTEIKNKCLDFVNLIKVDGKPKAPVYLFHDKFGNNIKMAECYVEEVRKYEVRDASDGHLKDKEAKEFLNRLIETNKHELKFLKQTLASFDLPRPKKKKEAKKKK